MRLALLLSLAAGACAPSPPASNPSAPAPVGAAEADTALVSLIQEPDGSALVSVSFRLGSEEDAADASAISPAHPLRVETPTGLFEAAIDGEPRVTYVQGTVVSSAEYRLAAAGVSAVEQAGERARVSVHDGERYRTYAVRRVDFLE